jgi:hypothetical protein
MIALVVSCILAAILGFAAHRASVCTVRAVAEMTYSRTGYMLAGIGKSAIWVAITMFGIEMRVACRVRRGQP